MKNCKDYTGFKFFMVLILILLGVLYYFVFYSKDEVETESVIEEVTENVVEDSDEIDMSGWQTYENEEYGFSLKYPEGWGSIDMTYYNRVHFYAPSSSRPEKLENGEYEPGLEGDIWLIAYSNSKNLSIKDFFNGENAPNIFENSESNRSLKINDYQAIKFDNYSSGQVPIYYNVAIISVKDKIFEINKSNEKNKDNNIFDSMINTFSIF